MKTREGFVSNSSTSSFICNVCGGIEGGMDACYEDVYMWSCASCGSEFHDHCVKPEDSDLKEELAQAINSSRCDVDKKFCPVCALKILTEEDEMLYYRIKYGYSNKNALEAIKEEYGTFDNFMDEVKKWRESQERNENKK